MNTKLTELLVLLKAASHALKSYQYGNSSPILAEEVSKKIDAVIAKMEKEK